MTDKRIRERFPKRLVRSVILVFAAVLLLILAALAYHRANSRGVEAFLHKAVLLAPLALRDEIQAELGVEPASDAQYVVFFSFADATHPAVVVHDSGSTPVIAWNNAMQAAINKLRRRSFTPEYVKAELVCYDRYRVPTAMTEQLASAAEGDWRWGVAMDTYYTIALTEMEGNASGAYDYAGRTVDINRYNKALRRSGGRTYLDTPQVYIAFRTLGFFCGEDDLPVQLDSVDRYDGRRDDRRFGGETCALMLSKAGAFLAEMADENGRFSGGVYAYDGAAAPAAGIPEQAEALLALCRSDRLDPDADRHAAAALSARWLADAALFDGSGETAFLCGENDEEISLLATALTAAALAEYEETYLDGGWRPLCAALGRGLLRLFDVGSGRWSHVCGPDLTPKEAFRGASWDGAATYALCRVYGVTGDGALLDAAGRSMRRMIDEGYAGLHDPWVCRSIDELTKYDGADAYAAFAFENLTSLLMDERVTAGGTADDLDAMLRCFLVHKRLPGQNDRADEAAEETVEEVVRWRIASLGDRLLSSWLFPEYAMYMAEPGRMQGAFVDRGEHYRISPQIQSSSLMACCLYLEQYEALQRFGVLPA